MQGTVVETLLDQHATLLLPTGQSVVIEWNRIDRIDWDGGPASVQERDDEDRIQLTGSTLQDG